MSKKIKSKSPLTIAAVFIIFFVTPIAVSYALGQQTIGGYLSPLLLLLFTWWLYKQEGKGLSELGLVIKPKNISFLFTGLVTGILLFSILILVQAFHNGSTIHLNKNADMLLIAGGIFYLLAGVLNEELIFRGYCFKKTIEIAGLIKATIIFAILFITWHWVATKAWGDYGLMIGLMTTGFLHILFAAGLLRSKTLFFPIGIHLGYNWTQSHLFSQDIKGVATEPASDIFLL